MKIVTPTRVKCTKDESLKAFKRRRDTHHLAAGAKLFLEMSGLSISRKLVSNVLRDDCAFELLEPDDLPPFSFPLSILTASCMATITSCILGLLCPRCSTHWFATSATLQIDSIFTFPTIHGSMIPYTSPLRISDLACIVEQEKVCSL